MRTGLIVILLGACAAACDVSAESDGEASSPQISGTASVIDGDTIEIHGERIRLTGFDTPERGSRCGAVNVYQKAALALSDKIGSRTVMCDTKSKDRHGRHIGDCRVGSTSLAEYMVEEGWGRDWPQYSHGAYADEEARARASKKGLWGLDCPIDLWGSRTYN